MTLVVETGDGLSNATSYISVADADSYFSDRNNSAWAALTTAQKEAGLLYATTTLDTQYKWDGYKKTSTQALDWPRISAEDGNGDLVENQVPVKIKQACCELALLHQTGALNSTFDRGGSVKREKVGSVEVEYFDGAPAGKTYPFIDNLVAEYQSSGGGAYTIELIRS